MLLMQVAPKITIEVEESGLSKIQITDNGEGMAQADVAMSFAPSCNK